MVFAAKHCQLAFSRTLVAIKRFPEIVFPAHKRALPRCFTTPVGRHHEQALRGCRAS